MGVVIRGACERDAGAVAGLTRQLAFSMGEESPVTEEYVRKYLKTDGVGIMLAEAEGKVLGMISYSIRPGLFHAADSGLIEDFVVDAAFRGKGVGRMLFQGLLDYFRTRGCAEAAVTTMPDNKAAQRFYKAGGMVDEALYLEKHF